MSRILGIDVGGTFTDLVAFDQTDGRVHAWKTLTTPGDPIEGIVNGLNESVHGNEINYLRLGTTIATNALVERKGVRVAYLTTKGFRDVPFIQSGKRKGSYDITWIKTRPFLDRFDAFEIDERVGADGNVIRPVDEEEVRRISSILRDRGVEAVAVCLLFSYVHPDHEIKVRDVLREELPGVAISISFDVVPRWKEYSRAATTIADAYIKPLLEKQVGRVAEYFDSRADKPKVVMIKSNGGEVALKSAAQMPVNLAVSGPTGGVVGARELARLIGEDHVITLDIGGTSTDCAIVADQNEKFTNDFEIEFGLPIQVPMIDIRTFGAGGGSIAWIDAGGMLRVGPHSAGSVPGPACYGRGGTQPTVTDANVVLGRIDPDNFLGGTYKLDLAAARAAVDQIGASLDMTTEQAASAIIRIVNNNTLGALRSVLTEQGQDPREFAILGFGGAGPLHVADLMIEGGMKRAIVPNNPGQFSAYGFLLADARVDIERTGLMSSLDFDTGRLNDLMSSLVDSATSQLREQGYEGDIRVVPSVDMRYLGQSHELTITLPSSELGADSTARLFQDFNDAYEDRYGYSSPDEALEIVTLKVTAAVATPKPDNPRLPASSRSLKPRGTRTMWTDGEQVEVPVFDRLDFRADDKIEGPALIDEPASVTVLPADTALLVDEYGNLTIQITGERTK